MTSKHKLLRNAFAILQAFRTADEELTSIELSRRSGVPRASGHRLAQTLAEIGAISRCAKGRYRLGMMLASLSRNVAIGDLLRSAGEASMKALATRLNVTVHMGILERDMVTYVAKVSLPTSFSVHTRVGAQQEAYCSGLGKVLLAALPEQSFEAFISSGGFVALTPRTITRAASLAIELETTRARGYALDNGECLENMFCAAAPITDCAGHTIAAISTTDNALSMSPARQHDLVRGVIAAADTISRLIGRGQTLGREMSLPAGSRGALVAETHGDRDPRLEKTSGALAEA